DHCNYRSIAQHGLPPRVSLAPDLHLPRPHGFDFRQMNSQDTVLALRLDTRAVNRLVDLEHTIEVAFVVFARQVLSFDLPRRHPGVHAQLAALEAQVHVLGADARHVGIQHQLLVRLVDVHPRREIQAAPGRLRSIGIGPLLAAQGWILSHMSTAPFVRVLGRNGHSPLTGILRGRADSCLASLMRRTPWFSWASTLLASTGTG